MAVFPSLALLRILRWGGRSLPWIMGKGQVQGNIYRPIYGFRRGKRRNTVGVGAGTGPWAYGNPQNCKLSLQTSDDAGSKW